MIAGPEHHLWREDASVRRIHAWLREHYAKAGVCEECGRVGKTHYAFQHHPQPHTRNREDYCELCPRCHVRFDGLNPRRSHCQRGHELTPANVLESQGRRWCKTCRNDAKRDSNREYMRRKRAAQKAAANG